MKKGIVGIEAAIVLIAFVIVAAALAFVVLNMGMYTTQKSKDVMQQGLNEATSALEVDGSVLGYVNETDTNVTGIFIPLKISPGQLAVDFDPNKIDVVLSIPNGTFSKVYAKGTFRVKSPANYTELLKNIGLNKVKVNATVYRIQGDNDNVLEPGEKFLLVIKIDNSIALKQYDKFTVEIRPLQGAPLTIERVIPPSLESGKLVNLG